MRAEGEAVGHVTTGEYGSQMLSLGGVAHLTGGSKAEGRATCAALLALCNREPVELTIDGGADRHRAGRPAAGGRRGAPSGACGSAAARRRSACSPAQWHGLVDEVVVVDDHITGVVSEHQAGKRARLGADRHPHQGPPLDARGATSASPSPGSGWGGTRLDRPAGDPRRRSTPRRARGPG